MKSVVLRYLSLLRRHRRASLTLVIAVTAAALCAACTLRVETDWTKLLPYAEDMTVFRALNQLGSSTTLMIHVEDAAGAPIATRQEAVQALADLVQESGLFSMLQTGGGQQALEGFRPELTLFLGTEGTRALVRRFEPEGMRESVGALMDMMFSPAASVARGLLERDPLQVSALAANRLELSGGYALRDGLIQSEDGMRALFLAIPPPAPDSAWMARLAEWIPRMKEAALRDGLICRMPGSLFLRAELFDLVKRDLAWTSLLSLGLIFLLFLAVYRRSRSAALCVTLPQITALALTFSFYRCFSAEIGLITSMAAAMLIGLGVDFGTHLMARYRVEPGSPEDRLAAALLGSGRGNLAGALSTAIAFLAILVTDMRSFYLLGCTAGFGILISVFTYFLVFPLLVFSFDPYKQPETLKIDPKPRNMRLFCSISVFFALLIFVLLPVSALRWRFSSEMDEMMPKNSLIMQDMLALEGKNAKLDAKKADCLFVEVENHDFNQSLAFSRALEGENTTIHWQTPFSWLPDADQWSENRAYFVQSLAERGITASSAEESLRTCYESFGLLYPPALEGYAGKIMESFNGQNQERFYLSLPFAQAFFTSNGASFFMTALHADGSPWSSGELEQFRQAASHAGLKAQVSSSRCLMEELRRRVIPDTLLAGFVTLAGMLVLLKSFFSRWSLVALTLVPLALGMLITVTVMGLIGQSFNYFNLTVFPLIIGLGIDDGIHYVQSVRECGDPRLALRRTRQPILLTTVTTCMGFGTLMLVSFHGIFSMGLMLVTGMLSCLLAVLVFLPALTHLVRRLKSSGLL